MRKQADRAAGSVSVFLALSVLILLCLLTALTESVRIRAGRVSWQIAAGDAARSLQASYCRELFDRYGVLFYWPGKTVLSEEAEALFLPASDPSDGLFSRAEGLYPLRDGEASFAQVKRACDGGGYLLRRQMLAAAAADTLTSLAAVLDEQAAIFESAEQAAEGLEEAYQSYSEPDWEALAQNLPVPEPPEGEDPPPPPGPDEDQKSFFDALLAYVRHPFLQLVLPPGAAVSSVTIDSTDVYVGNLRISDAQAAANDLIERGGLCAFALGHTGCFTEPNRDGGLQYETEYLIGGGLKDEDNLAVVAGRVFAVRQGMNAAYLVSDGPSMAKVATIANAVFGWTGIAWLVEGAKGVLVYAWSFAESVLDTRALLAGKKVAFAKTRETFVLSPDNLAAFAGASAKETESGMDYREYLLVFLAMLDRLALTERMGGLMQMHMRTLNPAFRLDACIGEAVLAYDGELKGRYLAVVPIPGIRSLYRFHVERTVTFE